MQFVLVAVVNTNYSTASNSRCRDTFLLFSLLFLFVYLSADTKL